jgi:hypothetical protein
MNSMNTSMNSGANSMNKMMGGRRMTRKAGGAHKAIGTRAEVMHGTAHHTSGGLTAKDLKYNKHGRIVSRKASEAGKKALKHLERAGYKARKGQFKLFSKTKKAAASRKASRKARKASRKSRRN